MSNVIQFESRRTGEAKHRAPINGSAEILIYNGVRFERLEDGETPPKTKPEDASRRNLAV